MRLKCLEWPTVWFWTGLLSHIYTKVGIHLQDILTPERAASGRVLQFSAQPGCNQPAHAVGLVIHTAPWRSRSGCRLSPSPALCCGCGPRHGLLAQSWAPHSAFPSQQSARHGLSSFSSNLFTHYSAQFKIKSILFYS